MPDAIRLLDPKLDVVFKMVLQRDLALVRSMIEAIVVLPAPIASLEILNPEIPKDLAADKCVELDVRVSLENQARVDIEMQTQVPKWIAKRFLYYWAREYSTTIGRGGDYRGILPVYSILWLNEDLFPFEHFHGIFHLSEDRSRSVFCSDLEIHTLELQKFRRLSVNESPALNRWSRFLVAQSRDEYDRLAEEDPIMSTAKEALEQVSADPNAQNLAREREESFLLYRQGLLWERQLGRTEGKAEEARATLTRQASKRFGSLPSWAEDRIANASYQQLEALLDAILTVTSIEELFRSES